MSIFNYVLRFAVDVETLSPVRTGNVQQTPDSSHYADGTYIIPGSAIGGAIRSFADRYCPEDNSKGPARSRKAFQRLLGSHWQKGQMTLSDLVFEEAAKTSQRARMGTKSSAVYTALQTGSAGHFEVVWKGEKAHKENAKESIRWFLSEIDTGVITLGAERNNGMGLVRLEVRLQEYDMLREDQREKWLLNKEEEQTIALHTCCFLGRGYDERVPELLRASLRNLIVNYRVRQFYVGNRSRFDELAKNILEELNPEYPEINCTVIAPDRNEVIEDERAASNRCSKWMTAHSDYIVTDTAPSDGYGLGKLISAMIRQEKTVIDITSPDAAILMRKNKVRMEVEAITGGMLSRAADGMNLGKELATNRNTTDGDTLILASTVIKSALRRRMNWIERCCEDFYGLTGNVTGIGMNQRKPGVMCISDGVFYHTDDEEHLLGRKKYVEVGKGIRIGLDQITGTNIRNTLVTIDIVRGRLCFSIELPEEIESPNNIGRTEKHIELLLLALRDYGLGLYSMGSLGSIGFGLAKELKVTICKDGRTPAILEVKDEKVTIVDEAGILPRSGKNGGADGKWQ